MEITFVVPANAVTTNELLRNKPGTTRTNPDSPGIVISMLSAAAVPPNSTVNFTEDVEVFTAYIHTSSKDDVPETAV
jgi:hypothetical protein